LMETILLIITPYSIQWKVSYLLGLFGSLMI